jgi:hypothetical protein
MAKDPQDGNQGAASKASAKQDQRSGQSMHNPSETDKQRAQAQSSGQSRDEKGSTQNQDAPGAQGETGAAERPSAGTPDLPRERGKDDASDVERGSGGYDDSLVNDPSGAFKERP